MSETDYLTAETEEGYQAIAEVANSAIPAAVEIVPREWAIVRRVNGEPVSFALVDPGRKMRFGKSAIGYGYIHTIATRSDRRSRGHFTAMLEEVFSRLKLIGRPFVILHGAHALYQRFGFERFTYHSGIFISPGAIESSLGNAPLSPGLADLIEVCDSQLFMKDLLYITHASAGSLEEARGALLAAARLARERNKARILIEHPDAPSYGSTYPIYRTLETPLTAIARACGGKVVVQGAGMGHTAEDDWMRILDPLRYVQEVLECLRGEIPATPPASIWIETELGGFGLESDGCEVAVRPEIRPGMLRVSWSAADLAQLTTGYHTPAVISAVKRTPLPPPVMSLLDAVFLPGWRLSRNVSWMTRYRPVD
jgi:GNAT superfamily N-acetyltransferase